MAHTPPLEGISRAATFWAMTMRSDQFPVRAIRWWTLLLIWRSRRWVLASAVDGVRPNGVKSQKKKARTDGDLPLGDDTEVPESVVPCGSGGEVGIAIVAPSPSPAHDEGVVTLGPHGHGVSIEHQRRILAIRGGSQHRTEYCGGHVHLLSEEGRKTWWSIRSNLRADMEAWRFGAV